MQDVALWGRLGPKVVSSLNSFTPQEFAQTLWAFATAEAEFRVSCISCSKLYTYKLLRNAEHACRTSLCLRWCTC